MASKHNKEPQVHKSEEELLKDKSQMDEVARKRRKAADILFPWLEERSKSIEDAKLLCQVISAGIRQAFGNGMRKDNVASLDLLSMLNVDDPKSNIYREFLEMFATEKIQDALEVIEGLPNHIDNEIRREMTVRPLESLDVEFIQEKETPKA